MGLGRDGCPQEGGGIAEGRGEGDRKGGKGWRWGLCSSKLSLEIPSVGEVRRFSLPEATVETMTGNWNFTRCGTFQPVQNIMKSL